MSYPHQPSAPDGTFESIEAALGETARGRWFLAEHARRGRASETRLLLDAVARLETVMAARPTRDDLDRLRGHMTRLGAALACAKAEVAGLASDRTATLAVLDANERIQEIAWALREAGFDAALCDALDARATEISAAGEVQASKAGHVDSLAESFAELGRVIDAMNATLDGPAESSGEHSTLPARADPPLEGTPPPSGVAEEANAAGGAPRDAAADQEGMSSGMDEPPRSPVAALLARLQGLDARTKLRVLP